MFSMSFLWTLLDYNMFLGQYNKGWIEKCLIDNNQGRQTSWFCQEYPGFSGISPDLFIFSYIKFEQHNCSKTREKEKKMHHSLSVVANAELKVKVNSQLNCTEFYDYLSNNPNLLKQIWSSDKYTHVAKIPRRV